MPAMLTYPHIDPVALQIGPLAIHWYGLTYLAGFALFLFLGTRRLRHEPYASLTGDQAWSRKDVEDILFLGVVGVVLGGRLGYCLFYKPGYYLAHPLEIFAIWQGGMSFHGGLLGVIAAMLWFAHSRRRPWLQVADFVAPCVPTGLAAGRIGNFINGELWGRFSAPDLPWGMVFPQSGSCSRAIRRRSTSSCSKGCCCSCCCGCMRAARAGAARWPPRSWWATARCASRPSISASPTVSWACCRWT